MSETLCEELPLHELMRPTATPEMGFQSYEMLKGDGANRERLKDDFVADRIVVPELDYPNLDEAGLDSGIARLGYVLGRVDREPNPQTRSIIWDTVAYRMAEMYWLKSASQLQYYARLGSTEMTDLWAARYQELNEQLYGRPEKEIVHSIYAEVWAQIDSKELSDEHLQLRQELEHGTVLRVAGDTVSVGVLTRPETARLPDVPAELLSTLRDKLYAENGDIVTLAETYWRNVIHTRPEGERTFGPQDIFELFKAVHRARDPEGSSGVSVIMDQDASALSWDTSRMAVVVGARRKPIKDAPTMISKIFHEYVVHGGRSISGSRTAMPVLGTGLFTDTDPGEVSDYLTFEEGLAGMCEMAIVGVNEGWKPINIERYMATALAYEGRDFRQIYEVLWRSRVLMSAKPNQPPSEAELLRAKRNAYQAVERVLRGTPTTLPRVDAEGNPRVLTYNKDLAYLKGKLQVLDFWNRYRDDPTLLDLVFKAKFDPMNRRQLAITREIFPDVPAVA